MADEIKRGEVVRMTATITRPADTTQYSINDGISSSTSAPADLLFSEVTQVRSKLEFWGGVATSWLMMKDEESLTSTDFKLYLFSGIPNATPNDNAAYLIQWEDRASFVGFVDFSTWVAGATGAAYAVGVPSFTPAVIGFGAEATLYGVLTAQATYAPTSGEIFHLLCSVMKA